MIESGIFKRTERLLGSELTQILKQKRVLVVGVGGVGSWCVESLVRTGIGHITIVDSDNVCITNINRQLMATVETVGQPKVDVLKARMLSINPALDIEARKEIYSDENYEAFHLDSYDYVIDAIDSLDNKASLIRRVCATKAVLFSSMGAALKIDPTRVSVAEFWNVKGCPLAAALRRKFKRSKDFPKKKFKCVFSDELLTNEGADCDCGTEECVCRKERLAGGEAEWHQTKKQANGSLSHITAIFGFTLAGLVISDIRTKAIRQQKS